MSELLFVTVGTTAISNRKIGSEILYGLAHQYLKEPAKGKDSFANRRSLERDLVAAHSEFWRKCGEQIPGPDEFVCTSAELTSTIPLLRQQPSITQVIFLSSDTPEGKLAARVNRQALQGIWKRCEVLQETIEGLEKGFTKVMPALETILTNCGANAATRVYFNITGGFKGVIPSVTYLATKHSGWSLYYQHEGLNSAAEVFFSGAGTSSPALEEEEMEWDT